MDTVSVRVLLEVDSEIRIPAQVVSLGGDPRRPRKGVSPGRKARSQAGATEGVWALFLPGTLGPVPVLCLCGTPPGAGKHMFPH